jgi:hypothetical protein
VQKKNLITENFTELVIKLNQMDLSIPLKCFYGENNVTSRGCIHHIYPANDSRGCPRFQVYLPEIISVLTGFAQIHNLRLKNIEAGGCNVYDTENVFLGTIVIHYF